MRRHSQAVRRGPAKPLSPVRFRVAPPKIGILRKTNADFTYSLKRCAADSNFSERGGVQMLYQFDIKMDDSDYYEFSKYDLSNSPKTKKSITFLRLYLPGLLLLVWLFFALYGFE